jgi:integrase
VFIEKEFYPTFLEAVELEEAPYPTIIKLLLHTGLRKQELLSLKWEYVDLKNGIVTIPETKNGRVHVLPLTKVAAELIKELPRDNTYLFHYQGHRLLDLKRPWDRIREKVGRKDLRIHDLRRTIGSWLAQSGVSLQLIGEVLNHKNPKTTMVYARFQKTHVREAIEGVFD